MPRIDDHHACNCGNCGAEQPPEPLLEQACLHGDENRQSSGRECLNYCCGVSAGEKIQHQHNAVDRSSSGADCTLCHTTKSSNGMAESADVQRNGMTWKQVGRSKSSSVEPTTPTTAVKKQIALYGWYLMRPKRGECSSSSPSVAIGGYKTPKLSGTDFIQTAPVEQRLERWMVATYDGLEVRLMGTIDVRKSVANGFSPLLVQYFIVGFLTNWVHLIVYLDSRHSKCSTPGLPFAADPAGATGVTQDGKNRLKECQELPVEANPILRQMTATLLAAPDEGTQKAALHIFSPTSSISLDVDPSNAESIQQLQVVDDQAETLRTNCNFCSDTEIPPVDGSASLPNMLPVTCGCPCPGPQAPMVEGTDLSPVITSQTFISSLCGGCHSRLAQLDDFGCASELPEASTNCRESEDNLAMQQDNGEDAGHSPEKTILTSASKVSIDCPFLRARENSGTNRMKIAELGKGEQSAQMKKSNLRTTNLAAKHRTGAKLLGRHVPCTPLQTTQMRSRKYAVVHIADESRTEPVVELASAQIDTGKKLRSGRLLPAADKLIRQQSVDRSQTLQTSKTQTQLRSCKPASSDLELSVTATDNLLVTRSLEDLSENLADAAKLDIQTPLQISRKRLHSKVRMPVSDKSYREPAIDPLCSVQNLEARMTLRSGKYVVPPGEPVSAPPESPVNSVQSTKSMERKRKSALLTPVDNLSRKTFAGALPVAKACDGVVQSLNEKVGKGKGVNDGLQDAKEMTTDSEALIGEGENYWEDLAEPWNSASKKHQSGEGKSYKNTRSKLLTKSRRHVTRTKKMGSCALEGAHKSSLPAAKTSDGVVQSLNEKIAEGKGANEGLQDAKEMTTDSEALIGDGENYVEEPAEPWNPVSKKHYSGVWNSSKDTRGKLLTKSRKHETGRKNLDSCTLEGAQKSFLPAVKTSDVVQSLNEKVGEGKGVNDGLQGAKETTTYSKALIGDGDNYWEEPAEPWNSASKKRQSVGGNSHRNTRKKLHNRTCPSLEETQKSQGLGSFYNSPEDLETFSTVSNDKSRGKIGLPLVSETQNRRFTRSAVRNMSYCHPKTGQQGTEASQPEKRGRQHKNSMNSSPQTAYNTKEYKSWTAEAVSGVSVDFHESEDIGINADVFNTEMDFFFEKSADLRSSNGKDLHKKTRKHESGTKKMRSSTLEGAQKSSQPDPSCISPVHQHKGIKDKSCAMVKTRAERNLNMKADRGAMSPGRRDCTTASNAGISRGENHRRRNSIVPPPLPSPRVPDKSKVMEAFGLKTSRSGRVLVPRLATWCNQSIKYDMDGGIIAISHGFVSDIECSTGCNDFKLPSDKRARTMQKRLCKAADKAPRKIKRIKRK